MFDQRICTGCGQFTSKYFPVCSHCNTYGNVKKSKSSDFGTFLIALAFIGFMVFVIFFLHPFVLSAISGRY